MIPPFDNNGNLPENDNFYRPTIKQFIDRFVKVNDPRRRNELFSKYNQYIKRFKKILNKIWIDGSYTTEKAKPGDIDLTVHYDALKLDDLRTVKFMERKTFLDKAYIYKTYECHTQYVPIYPKEDIRYALTKIQYNKWKKHFTKDKKGNPKGLIEMSLS